MTYIDGFVSAVPTKNKEKYLEHSRICFEVCKEFGALRGSDCWGEDVPEGKVTSFPSAVKKKDDETIVFSWVEWPSKEVRDEGMRKFMRDERVSEEKNPMPFDGQRLIFGCFEKFDWE